jgi:hypothetical protein
MPLKRSRYAVPGFPSLAWLFPKKASPESKSGGDNDQKHHQASRSHFFKGYPKKAACFFVRRGLL